jgi:MFS family permease
MVLFLLSRYILTVGFASAAIYSVLVPISDATGLTISDMNAGTGYMFLAFGWGCLFWQPLAQRFGKRPVYLIGTLATTVSHPQMSLQDIIVTSLILAMHHL